MTVPIDSFPDDDIERVVWAHGKLLKNYSAYSSNPQVQVALVELGPSKKISENKCIVVNVTIAELDIVRLGCIFRKKVCIALYHNAEEHKFSFVFTSPKIKSINFFDKKPNSNNYYIPPFAYEWFFLKKNEQHVSLNNFNTKLTLLYADNGVNVFIPALELFTSTYASDKEIRKLLITKSIDEVIEHNLVNSRCYEDPDNGNYITSFNNNSMKHIKNRIFLGYLRHNKITRERVSKVWTNLSINEHPQIEPYHPITMELEVEGIWLDSKKHNFLVLRINGCSLPLDHKVIPEIPSNTTNSKGERNDYTKKHYQEVEIDINKPVSSEIDPSTYQGTAYITSEVKIIGEIPSSEVKIRPRETNSCNHETVDSDASSLSSGDRRYSIENARTASLKNKELDEYNENNVLDDTYNTLEQLRGNGEVFQHLNESMEIVNIICYDSKGSHYSYKFYTTFPGNLVGKDGIHSWPLVSDYKLRKILLCKIKLNNHKEAFLLEIQRKKSESYKGLLFHTTTGDLTQKTIKELLLTIAKNKGQLTHSIPNPSDIKTNIHTEIELPSSIATPYAFKHGPKDKNYSRMHTIINDAINKGVFAV